MTKTLSLAAALSLAGCATAPGTPVTTNMAERAYALHEPTPQTEAWRGTCYALGDFEPFVRQARADGLSIKQAKAMTAMVALKSGEVDTQYGKMTGTLMFMTISHVYEGRTGSAVDRCIDEMWPQAAYIATL